MCFRRKKQLLFDSNPFGGTCQLRSCDPKKVLVGISRVLELSTNLLDKGIISPATTSWKDMILFKQSFTDPTPSKNEESLSKAGIMNYHGRVHFTSENTLQINRQSLTGDKFCDGQWR